MMRLITLWIAVASLTGMGIASVVSLIARHASSDAGWTYYSPYSTTTVLPLSLRIVSLCSQCEALLLPIAALSSAAFMVLLDRQVRSASRRGFAVEVADTAPGK